MKTFTYLRDALLFAPCYVLLDWVSYIEPLGAFNITPWNPQPALAVVWMLLGGIHHAPVVFATIVLADIVVRGLPGGLGIVVSISLALTLGYAAIAWGLQRLLRPKPDLHSLRQLTTFIAVVVPATACIALVFVGVIFAFGHLAREAFVPGWLQFWVGDAVGVLVTAPLLLVAADREQRRGFAVLAGKGETYLQIGLVAAAIWLIFRGLGGDPSHHVYLLFLPLIWVALRNGLTGAILSVGVVQIGVVLGIHGHSLESLPVMELQALVAALTLTALYLGVMVDERRRANERLRQSLRLAAAGEMAGAIAHEVNQPLTALTTYGQSGQLLLQAGRTEELQPVLAHMLQEAQRASEIVRRLRDFFREGTTRLERVQLEELLRAAEAVALDLGRDADIGVRTRCEAGLPAVLADRIQIELVLRNLVANGIESVRAQGPGAGRIELVAQRAGASEVQIAVLDSGPGVSMQEEERIFEAFVSGKSTGMGLGLAVSRAIAEAHGGRLVSQPGVHGEFRLFLPVGSHG
jgi:two-component system sensor kinase FixL